MDAGSIWIRKEIDKLAEDLKQMSAICPFDNTISGAGTSVMHRFEKQRQRTRGGKVAGEVESFTRRLYVNVFQSPERKLKREFDFKKDLLELKRQIEEGQTEFTKAGEAKIAKYLISTRMGCGEQLKIFFNDGAVQDAMKYFGHFALVSNQSLELFTSLEYYRLREKIEELFADQKGYFDSSRPLVWFPDNLRGRQFVQFTGLGYYCFIAKKIKEVQQQLGKDKENKSQERLKMEKQLDKWLENHSFAQIMDWFGCIEATAVKTETVKVRWSTETIERDRLFLELLGVFEK